MQVHKQVTAWQLGDSITATAGDNAFMYTSPEVMDGLTLVASYAPQASTAEDKSIWNWYWF